MGTSIRSYVRKPEKIYVNINGAAQGMFIEGKDQTQPVLLFLHGGPGMPEHFLTGRYPTGLEDLFTVCWWEQRLGALLPRRPAAGEADGGAVDL